MKPSDTESRQPILITGAHRSGTTWVGKMLAASPQVAYLSEPLNVWHRPGVMRARVAHWYTYICAENEAAYLPAFRETLRYRYHLWAEIRSLRSLRDVLRMGRDGGIFLRGRIFRQRALLKDPFAVFSIPWFAERLGCAVVVAVRQPAAFASSLVRLGWSFDFGDLLAQPLLMRDCLEPFRADIEEISRTPNDVIAQSCLLWRIIYTVVADYKARLPNLWIVSHEGLSRRPVEGFRQLYADLGLSFTPRVEQAISKASSPQNPAEVSRRAVHSVRLDSQTNLSNWKRRLTSVEIARIRQLTADVADGYYPEDPTLPS